MATWSPAPRHPITHRALVVGLNAALVPVVLFVLGVTLGIPGGSRIAARPTPFPTPDVAMTVPLGATGQISHLHLGTNLTTPAEVASATDPAHGALLQAWSPSLVRLHLGFTGDDIALPAGTSGQWDFTALDATVARLRAAHIPFFVNVRAGPPWMYDSKGQLRDQTYHEFARYMARLVGWYNAGGFTDDAGQYHASGHRGWVTTWEVWNEPNSGYDIPVSVANQSATWLAASDFARLYSVAAMAMRAVDPAIQTGGPTISAYPDDPYVVNFIAGVTAPLDFFSFHFYAIGDQQTPDQAAFDAVAGKFAHRLALARATLDARFPGKALPIWVDEVGYNEVSRYPVDPRGAAPVGLAFAAQAFITATNAGVTQFTQFPFLGNAQLALVDNRTYKPYLPLRFYETLARAFPAGVTLRPMTPAPPAGTVALAAMSPDGASLRLLIANLTVAHPTDVNGPGAPVTVRVTLTGATSRPTSAAAWIFDATTDASHAAKSHPLPIIAEHGNLSVQARLSGYGVAIIEIPLH